MRFVGAALRVLGAGAKAAKFAKGAVLSRIGQGLQGAGRACLESPSKVLKQVQLSDQVFLNSEVQQVLDSAN